MDETRRWRGRCVIVREIHNATRFWVATFTRTTRPFLKMLNATPIGLFPTGTLYRKNRATPVCNMLLVSLVAAFVDSGPLSFMGTNFCDHQQCLVFLLLWCMRFPLLCFCIKVPSPGWLTQNYSVSSSRSFFVLCTTWRIPFAFPNFVLHS